MKVLEIITEAASTAANITPEMEAAVAAYLKANPHMDLVQQYDPKAGPIARFLQKNQTQYANIEKSVAGRYSAKGIAFFKAAGVLVPLTMCWWHLWGLNELYKQDQASGNPQHNLEWYKKEEQAIIGAFLISQTIGIIIPALLSGSLTGLVVGIVAEGAMRAPGGGYAKLATMLVAGAALTGLKVWLNSDAGKQWLTTGFIMPYITYGIGFIGVKILDMIRAGIKDVGGPDIGILTPDINKEKDRQKELDFDMPDFDPKKAAADQKAQSLKRLNDFNPDKYNGGVPYPEPGSMTSLRNY